jgi:hypothetical protein
MDPEVARRRREQRLAKRSVIIDHEKVALARTQSLPVRAAQFRSSEIPVTDAPAPSTPEIPPPAAEIPPPVAEIPPPAAHLSWVGTEPSPPTAEASDVPPRVSSPARRWHSAPVIPNKPRQPPPAKQSRLSNAIYLVAFVVGFLALPFGILAVWLVDFFIGFVISHVRRGRSRDPFIILGRLIEWFRAMQERYAVYIVLAILGRIIGQSLINKPDS